MKESPSASHCSCCTVSGCGPRNPKRLVRKDEENPSERACAVKLDAGIMRASLSRTYKPLGDV